MRASKVPTYAWLVGILLLGMAAAPPVFADAPTVPGTAETFVFTVQHPPTADVTETNVAGHVTLDADLHLSDISFTGNCDDGSSFPVHTTLLPPPRVSQVLMFWGSVSRDLEGHDCVVRAVVRLPGRFVQFDPVEQIVTSHSVSIWVDGHIVTRTRNGAL